MFQSQNLNNFIMKLWGINYSFMIIFKAKLNYMMVLININLYNCTVSE